MKLEHVPCGLCGAEDAEPLARGWDFEYETSRTEVEMKECRGCAHVYLSPRPTREELSLIYPPNYYAYDMTAKVHPLALIAKRWLDGRKARSLLAYAPEKKNIKCLDVGCGDGEVLHLLSEAGVEPSHLYGVDLSPLAIDRVKQRGFHGFASRIEDLELEPCSFDVILMFQVIEHVENPQALIEKLTQLLTPGGVLICETPNVKSLDAKIFKKRYWGGYHFPRHWNLFHKKTLKQLGEQTGLILEQVDTFLCAVFWIYPFHHYLREKGFSPKLYRFFWPISNPLLLAIFSLVDVVLAPLGMTSNLRAIFRKP